MDISVFVTLFTIMGGFFFCDRGTDSFSKDSFMLSGYPFRSLALDMMFKLPSGLSIFLRTFYHFWIETIKYHLEDGGRLPNFDLLQE
jgi:hypothetical protein